MFRKRTFVNGNGRKVRLPSAKGRGGLGAEFENGEKIRFRIK